MKKLAVIAILAIGLAGCAQSAPDSGPSETDEVAAVEAAFLEALTEGDGDAAVALTTLNEGDLGCTQTISDYADLRVGIILAEAGTAVVDGDTATAKFTYSLLVDQVMTEITGSHTLVRDGDSWLIEFPDEYRIAGTLGADVVGQVGIMPAAAPQEPYTCTAAAVDGTYEIVALPGVYTLITSDPTGVFYNSESGSFVSVYDVEEPSTPAELNYIADDDRDLVANHIRDALEPFIDLCAASGFTDPICQDGLPVPKGPVTAPDRLPLDGIEIFSEDGLTWKFRAGGEDYLFQGANGIEKFEVYYSGTVTSDGTLYHQIALD